MAGAGVALPPQHCWATKKFLVYGQLMRPLEFSEPSPIPKIPYTSYIVRSETQFPVLMSGVFRSNDGGLGVFVVNAGTKDLEFQADMVETT